MKIGKLHVPLSLSLEGMGLNVEAVKVILEKCLKENKYFKVWNMRWKGDLMFPPSDWWEGKIAFYKYKM